MGMVGITKRGLIMNKIIVLLGFSINLIAMDPPPKKNDADAKQKVTIELIERNALSSGSVAPSSSVAKVTSTSTVTSDGGKTSDSSSDGSDMAQIDLDKKGYAVKMTKKEKRRSLVPIEADNLDDLALAETVIQVLQAREQQKQQQLEEQLARLNTQDKREKRKSVDLWLKKKQHVIPQLALGDLEEGKGQSTLSEDELERIIDFIAQATGNNISDIKDRLKVTLKQLHATPPASPLFVEKTSAIDALNTVRKLTNDHISTRRVADTLQKRQQAVHALQPADVISQEGFEAGLNELLKLVNAEFSTKLAQTGKARTIYKILSIAGGVVITGLGVYEAYNKATGGNSSTCAPTNTTVPM